MRKSLTLLAAAAVLSTTGLAQAADYQIDPTHTNVIWEQIHFGTSTNRGRFGPCVRWSRRTASRWKTGTSGSAWPALTR